MGPDKKPERIKFELSDEESEAARKFMKEHSEVCPNRGKYQGAIGVSYEFSFTHTSIGTMTSVICHCGAYLFFDP